jgi:hypothetical protein
MRSVRYCLAIAAWLVCAHSATAAPPSLPPGGFSIVIMPDTQNYTDVESRHEIFHGQTQWIRDHRDEYDIRYVLHLGDIVQINARTNEWDVARSAFSILDGEAGPIVPYALAVGNHDMGSTGVADTRHTFFRDPVYFGPGSPYATQSTIGGFFRPGETENSWHEFEVDGQRYLVLSLEFGPRDAVVAWADGVLERHPRHRAIIITHAYLFSSSARYHNAIGGQSWIPDGYGIATTSAAEGINDGHDLWKRLVEQNPNVKLVINGHVLNDGTGQLASLNQGKTIVHQVLANYQMIQNGGDGFLRMLQFMPDGETVKVYAFSTYTGIDNRAPDHEFTLAFTDKAVSTDHAGAIRSQAPVQYYRPELARGATVNDLGSAQLAATYEGSGASAGEYDGASLLTAPAAFSSSPMTMVGWVRPVAVAGGEEMLSLQGGTGLGLLRHETTGRVHWGVGDVSAGVGGAVLLDARKDVVPGNWYHLALVAESGRARLYVDGDLVAEHEGDSELTLPGTLTLGRSFVGRIGDVAFFDRALSTGDIAVQRMAAFNRLIAGNIAVNGLAFPGGNTVDAVEVPQQTLPGLSITQRNRGDYQMFVGGARPSNPSASPTGGIPALAGDGVMFAVAREHERDGVSGTAEAGSNSFGDGVISLATSHAGSGEEMNLATAVAWFPFADGWTGAHVSGRGDLIAARNLWQRDIRTLGNGRYRIDLGRAAGSNAGSKGLLFAIGTNNANRIVQAEPDRNVRQWTVQVRDNALGFGVQNDFAFVLVPMDSARSLGGLYDGVLDRHTISKGTFSASRTGPGIYRLEIPDQTPETGMLLLTSADVDAPVYATYEGQDSAFVIRTREVFSGIPVDGRFAWAFVSFTDPIVPSTGGGGGS